MSELSGLATPGATEKRRRTRDTSRRALVLLATSLGFGVIQLDVSVVNVAVKPIGAALGGGDSALQWVVDAYTLPFAALILAAGAFADRWGSRRLFLIGFSVFITASAGCGFATGIGELIAARGLQGVGAAMVLSCSLSLLAHSYPDQRKRAQAVGVWAAGASAALAAGPLIGGILIATVGWRSIFFVNVPVGIAGIWLTANYADETVRSRDRDLDLRGQLGAVVMLAALAFAMITAGTRGWTSTTAVMGFVVAALAAVIFLWVERAGHEPMLDLRLFRAPGFGWPVAIGFVVNIAFYGLMFVLSLYCQKGQHNSPLVTGLTFAPATAAILGANTLAHRLAHRCGRHVVLVGSALLMTAGCAALFAATVTGSVLAVALPLTAIGFGLGTIAPIITATVLGGVPPTGSGIAAGSLNAARQTGSVIGVALFGSLAATPDPASGLRHTLAVAATLTAVVALLARCSGSAGARR